MGIEQPEHYRDELTAELRKYTKREIRSRSKHLDVPISKDLKNCHCLVTHSSGACVDALLRGVPSIVLGPAIARNISSSTVADIEQPRLATLEERIQFLNDTGYYNWHVDELASGQVWQFIKDELKDYGKFTTPYA